MVRIGMSKQALFATNLPNGQKFGRIVFCVSREFPQRARHAMTQISSSRQNYKYFPSNKVICIRKATKVDTDYATVNIFPDVDFN